MRRTGLVFGLFQLRHHRVQQRDAIAQSLTQTFYNRDLAVAIALLQQVPDGISLAEIRSRGPQYEEAAVTVTTSFETMGILVHKRIAPFELVVDLSATDPAADDEDLWINVQLLSLAHKHRLAIKGFLPKANPVMPTCTRLRQK